VAVLDDLDFPDQTGQLSERDHDVHRHIAGRQAAHGAEGLLAALPKLESFGLVDGPANFPGSGFQEKLGSLRGILVDLFGLPGKLDDHRRGHIRREPEAEGFLDGRQHDLVHHLHREREKPPPHEFDHGPGGFVQDRKKGQQGPHRRKILNQGQIRPGHDAEGPLTPTEQAGQIDAALGGGPGPGRPGAAGGIDPVETFQVAARHPQTQAVRPAGVLGNVAADGGRRLAGRVRGEVKTIGGGVARDLFVEDPWLDVHLKRDPIHPIEARHPGGRQDQDPVRRHGPAAQPGPRAPTDDGSPLPRTRGDDPLHHEGVGGKSHGVRQPQSQVGSVARIDLASGLVIEKPLGAEDGPQFPSQVRSARHDPTSVQRPPLRSRNWGRPR